MPGKCSTVILLQIVIDPLADESVPNWGGEAARITREAVKDKSYRATPTGLEVAHFIRWFRNEYGATTETLRDYEAILAKLAIDHAGLELRDFEPPEGTTRLREFIDLTLLTTARPVPSSARPCRGS